MEDAMAPELVDSPRTHAAAAEVAPPTADAVPTVPLRIRAARALHAQGVGPAALLAFAMAFAALAAFLLLIDHPGLGAILATVALLASELALVPAERQFGDVASLVRGLSPLVDLLFMVALVGGVLRDGSDVVWLLGLVVLVLQAWLAMLGRSRGMPGLWSRADRFAVLLLGALIGRIGPALLFVAAVGIVDAWLRVERLQIPAGLKPEVEVSWAKGVIRDDGSFEPMYRWITLGLAALTLFLLPIGAGWRF
jgi:hypothetical protein